MLQECSTFGHHLSDTGETLPREGEMKVKPAVRALPPPSGLT